MQSAMSALYAWWLGMLPVLLAMGWRYRPPSDSAGGDTPDSASDFDENRVRTEAKRFYLMGEGIARLHAMGMTFKPRFLFDPSNFMITPEGRLFVSYTGLDYLVDTSAPSPMSLEKRVSNLLPAASSIIKPYWDTFADGYREKSKELEQEEVAEAALTILEPILAKVHEARLLHAQASYHRDSGGHAESLRLLQQEIAVYEDVGLGMVVGRLHVDLGRENDSLGDEAQALEHYEKAYEISQSHDDALGLVIACSALGVYHDERGEKPTAREYARQGLEALPQAHLSSQDEEKVRKALNRLTKGKWRVWR